MKYSVVIVAGGKGLRMGTEIPKQFLPLNDKPILFYTIDCFRNAFPEIDVILVLPQTEIGRWKSLSQGTSYQDIPVAVGGDSRFASVKSGLSLVKEGVVGIHDAVRPLVNENTIKLAFKTAEKKGSAIPIVPLKESIRKIQNDKSEAVDRSAYCLVQTPQCFQYDLLYKAYEVDYSSIFTDDASVFEAAGHQVQLIDGNTENIKITTPEDLKIAEALLGKTK